MTQGIRNFLNLPTMEDILREQGVLPDKSAEDTNEIDDNVSPDEPDSELMRTVEMAQQAQTRLDMVEGTDHAIALDKVFTETLKHAQDLMDLGFNVDIPRARGIFEVAANMYGQAISAKNSKRDAQLKAMKLALDQRKLDLDEKRLNAQLGETEKNTIVGEATVIKEDRNQLIKRMREKRDERDGLK